MTAIFQEEAQITAEPHADDTESMQHQPVWSDRPGDDRNINHHIWVCVPNDRDGQGMVDPDGQPLDYKGDPWDHMWVEIHSIEYDDMLNDDPRQHEKFKKLIGKRVRVTVEIID